MKEKLEYIRLPIILLLIFFIGRLVMSASGASYATGNRIFSMVILQVHLALIWAAFSRNYKGYGIGAAMQVGLFIALVSQIFIVLGTAGSYIAGTETYFNLPEAIAGTPTQETYTFGRAMLLRGGGLVINCIIGAVSGAIGWLFGALIPAPSAKAA